MQTQWESSVLQMIEEAAKGKNYDLAGLHFALAIEKGEKATPPKTIPPEMIDSFLNLAEHYTLIDQYNISQDFLSPLNQENCSSKQWTIKWYNEL